MMNPLKLCLLGLGLSMLPALSTASVPDSNSDMSRDAWLEAVRVGVAGPVCKSFMGDGTIAMELKARHIDYNKCVLLMPAITDKCEKKYMSSLPMVINDQNAEKWGQLLGECIGNDFAISYLSEDENALSSSNH